MSVGETAMRRQELMTVRSPTVRQVQGSTGPQTGVCQVFAKLPIENQEQLSLEWQLWTGTAHAGEDGTSAATHDAGMDKMLVRLMVSRGSGLLGSRG